MGLARLDERKVFYESKNECENSLQNWKTLPSFIYATNLFTSFSLSFNNNHMLSLLLLSFLFILNNTIIRLNKIHLRKLIESRHIYCLLSQLVFNVYVFRRTINKEMLDIKEQAEVDSFWKVEVSLILSNEILKV